MIVFFRLADSHWKRRRKARKAIKKDRKEAMEKQILDLEFAMQMGELEEKLVIEQPEEADSEDSNWWDQSKLV